MRENRISVRGSALFSGPGPPLLNNKRRAAVDRVAYCVGIAVSQNV